MTKHILAIALITATATLAGDDAASLAELAKSVAEANSTKNVSRMAALARTVTDAMGDAKDRSAVDSLAAEFSKSAKLCSRDYAALKSVVVALGRLRSKNGTSALKRIAFRKKVKDERLADVQAAALVAIGRLADPKYLASIEDQAKSRNAAVARGAYTGLASYGATSGRIRKRVAEILMGRLRVEYPRYAPGKRVSSERRERWNKVSNAVIRGLQAVCRESGITSVEAWEAWWHDNKKNAKAWRDEKKKPAG